MIVSFFLLIAFASALNFGEGVYDTGDYGIGELLPPEPEPVASGSSSYSSSGSETAGGYVSPPVMIEPDKPFKVVTELSYGGVSYVSYGGYKHSVVINKVYEDRITITIRSRPITTTVELNKPKLIDLDEDGIGDVYIILTAIDELGGEFTFASRDYIETEEVAEEAVDKAEEVIPQKEEIKEDKIEPLPPLDDTEPAVKDSPAKNALSVVFAVLALACFVALGYVVFKREKPEDDEEDEE